MADGFDIKLGGEVIHTIDVDPRLVTGIHVFTSNGEASASALSFGQREINITLDMQGANTLEVMEDDARLARAADAEATSEPLFANENARRLAALDLLAEDQKNRAAESDEDLTQQFALEREEVIANPSKYLNENHNQELEPTVMTPDANKTKSKSTKATANA